MNAPRAFDSSLPMPAVCRLSSSASSTVLPRRRSQEGPQPELLGSRTRAAPLTRQRLQHRFYVRTGANRTHALAELIKTT